MSCYLGSEMEKFGNENWHFSGVTDESFFRHYFCIHVLVMRE